MINRDAKDVLLRLTNQFPVVCVTGPRQCGKTTLAKMVFPDKKYVSLDDRDILNMAINDPNDFIKAFPSGAIIDEAQKAPDIFNALKMDADSNNAFPGKFIITGSSQFHLRKNMTDSLAGRAAFLQLLPFSVSELKQAKILPKDPYDLILKGQYPPLYDDNKKFITNDWLENYINTYLSKDIQGEISISNIATFSKFIQVCATRSGQILSMGDIANDVGVSSPTIKKWLSILEKSYIIHLLGSDEKSLGRVLVKSPKLYFIDTGLLCKLLRIKIKEDLLLHRMKGAVIETFAVSEILKSNMNLGKTPDIAYYRDRKGLEVDIVTNYLHSLVIEVKSSLSNPNKKIPNINKYLTLRDDKNVKGAIFYLGDLTVTNDEIDYVSWHDWGKYVVEKDR